MKNSRIFSTILAALLLPSIALAQGYTVPGSELARPRSLVDHGRTDRLTGTPNPISTPGYCPSGQVFSGGACVLISNPSSGLTITKVGVVSCFYDGGCSPIMGICVAGGGNPGAVLAYTGVLACPTGSGWIATQHATVTPP